MTTGRRGRGLPRGSRGAASPRVLLALIASSAVTLAVAGPMGYQAFEARRDGGTTPVEQPSHATTTAGAAAPSTLPPAPFPSVSPTSEVRNPSIALGPTTTEASDDEPSTTTSPPRSGRVETAEPTTTGPGAPTGTGPLTAPPPTTPPPTTRPPATTTTVPSPDGIVLAGAWPAHTRRPLAGAELRQPVIVYIDLPRAIAARFWLDDVDTARTPDRVDHVAPLTLVRGRTDAQPGYLDPRTLGRGDHTLLVEVTLASGGTERHEASFTVERG
jgi:hypothetical protein